jgi:hypothetical protein
MYLRFPGGRSFLYDAFIIRHPAHLSRHEQGRPCGKQVCRATGKWSLYRHLGRGRNLVTGVYYMDSDPMVALTGRCYP